VPLDQHLEAIIRGLLDAGVEFFVVGGAAAILQQARIHTGDVEIVHQRTPENIARLLPWLLSHHAYHRSDLANRRLPPSEGALAGHGHVLLETDLGTLDVLCELDDGQGYEEILPDAVVIDAGGYVVRVLGLPRLIREKSRANRPKDRAVLPVLIATLDEQQATERRAKTEG
jgi:hypothetical protein